MDGEQGTGDSSIGAGAGLAPARKSVPRGTLSFLLFPAILLQSIPGAQESEAIYYIGLATIITTKGEPQRKAGAERGVCRASPRREGIMQSAAKRGRAEQRRFMSERQWKEFQTGEDLPT